MLLNKEGILKIGDFGLARTFFPSRQQYYTTRVVTLWYRAPELLYGYRQYSTAIDMWSVGCFFAELLSGSAFLPGKDEASQLELIYDRCGEPDPKTWPELPSMPNW